MKLEEVPEAKGSQYTERISVPVRPEIKRKLEFLMKTKRRKTTDIVRMLLDSFLEDIEIKDVG